MRPIRLALLMAVIIVGSSACNSIERLTTSGEGDSASCPDCMTVADIIMDYEANSMRADRDYVGNRYNFRGKVESIGNSGKVPMPGKPPVPKVNIKSGGKPATFWFGFDTDNEWVLDYSKGDTMIANCRVRSLDSLGIIERGTPMLEDCTEQQKG